MTLARKPIRDAELVIVGLARNCARTLDRDIGVLARATRNFGSVRFLVIESDSTDATVATLTRLQSASESFAFVTLGALAPAHPLRTDRIAVCRNRYLQELQRNPLYGSTDYVLVADLDGVNRDLTSTALESCWQSQLPWDVCAANQLDAYYDIWALRHADWCPVDCWQQYRALRPAFGHEQALTLAIHSRMVKLDVRSAWIEVDSAFGGLALYRREAMLAARYRGIDGRGEQVCEHVAFHAGLRERGLRIFINPALINARRTEHSARARLHVRLRRRIEALGKRVRNRLLGR